MSPLQKIMVDEWLNSRKPKKPKNPVIQKIKELLFGLGVGILFGLMWVIIYLLGVIYFYGMPETLPF